MAFFQRAALKTYLQDAVLQNDDAASVPHSREAVGNDEGCAALGGAVEGCLNDGLAFIVQRRGGLVQEENLSRDQKKWRNMSCWMPLPLPTREGGSQLIDAPWGR